MADGQKVLAVNQADIKDAFSFLDEGNKGKISVADLKSKLAPFYPDMPTKEFQFLMGDKKFITRADLEELLEGNEITGFDPVAEAFKVYDPEGTGYADVEIMRQVFEGLGYSDLTGDDLEVLVEVADKDKDGMVSIQDFRALVEQRSAATAQELHDLHG